ncbi:hypothetical protein FRB91_007654 [Serendipita sp. 411]|nr:hypothetical protein FRC19_002436 [Serendipita sp. 401]KAG8851587.1 hypothetical protein FRB91_007654 [Serendipita sp. 411]KAG9022672.1 hypothetical protein FS842_005962 [Serendipita sp. 407]
MALSASEKYVVEQYGGLFLYAATICRLLKDRRRRMMMAKMILASNSPQDLVEKMDELHLSILRLVISHTTRDVLEQSLRYNILQIERLEELNPPNEAISDAKELLNKYTNPATHYSSLFWARHIEAFGTGCSETMMAEITGRFGGDSVKLGGIDELERGVGRLYQQSFTATY